MNCELWDIVAVPFPFLERPALKRRPALVISSQHFNTENDHAIMVMITTASLDSWPSDYHIADPAMAGLNPECYVRWKVFTLPVSLIVRRIGTLSAPDRGALKTRAQAHFAWV